MPLDGWKEEASADEVTVRVCLDRALYRRLDDAIVALERAKTDGQTGTLDGGDQLAELAAAVDQAAEALYAAERTMVFRQVGTGPNGRWRQLVRAHPPTAAQKKESPQGDVNPDAFWPEALAATCVDPGLTVDEAAWLRDGDDTWPGLPEARWLDIIGAVGALHQQGSDVPKSVRATVGRLRLGLNSTTPASAVSPSPSSEANG